MTVALAARFDLRTAILAVGVAWGLSPFAAQADFWGYGSRPPSGCDTDRLASRWLSPAHGITAEPVYTGEIFTNAKGGRSTNGATRYAALVDLAVTLDLEALGTHLPGRFYLLAQGGWAANQRRAAARSTMARSRWSLTL